MERGDEVLLPVVVGVFGDEEAEGGLLARRGGGVEEGAAVAGVVAQDGGALGNLVEV